MNHYEDDGAPRNVPKLRRKIAPTPKSRAARRLRRAIFATIFSSIMTHKLGELRWGQYVETVDNILLNTVKTNELPSTYLDALATCPLPPGWVTSVLPTELRHQIITYAKNKLVTLLTPVAKRRAHTIQLGPLRDQLIAEGSVFPTDTLLKSLSPMFDAWPPAALAELLQCGTRRAYRAGMWILPPSKVPYWNVNAMLLLHGQVAEVTLSRAGDDGTGLDASFPQPHTRATFSAPAMIGETRCVLATPSTAGYRARTNVLVFEVPFREVLRISDEQHLHGANRDKCKRFISQGRCAQATQSFRLDADMLGAMRFFEAFNPADNHLLAQAAKPRVAFDKDVVIHSSSMVGDIIIVSRGELEVRYSATASLPAGLSSSSNSDSPHPVVLSNVPTRAVTPQPPAVYAASAAAPLYSVVDVLRPQSVFGADYLVFEDRSPFSVVATCVTEYWVISMAALHSAMKNTSQRKVLVESAAHVREHMLTLAKQPKALLSTILADIPHLRVLAEMPEAAHCLDQIVHAATARVFKAGDRVVSAGDDANTFILVQTGRLHHLSITTAPSGGDGSSAIGNTSSTAADSLNMAKKTTVPCSLGSNFLMRGKWPFSLTAARICEAWVLQKQDVWRLLRYSDAPHLLNAVRSAMTSRSTAEHSPHHHHHFSTRLTSRQSKPTSGTREELMSNNDPLDESQDGRRHRPRLACEQRAEVRSQRKVDRDEKAQRVAQDEATQLRRTYRRLAPNISSRVSFVAYEGLHPVRPSAKEAYQAVRRIKSELQRESPIGDKDKQLNATITGGQSPLSPQASMIQRRRSSKSAMVRMERMTVHERVEDELDNQRLKMRRKMEASVSSNDAHLTDMPTQQEGGPITPRRRTISASTAHSIASHERPSAGKAEKNVLKQILAQHDAILAAKRAQADRGSDVSTVAMSNPFSSLEPHAPVPRLAPTGELVYQRPGHQKKELFEAKKYRHHSATSYLSAHAFTDL
ncbi:Hypothetical protein, putative [Bodo saltans]|uniref:Cyclic nucleotide-binding domain-containing protein n=1 Tax=Bodo saltans TaxID=75058 RepID=A0A0S4JCY4_BODSA|nr:Hypothetical protein, putative [Bodo saltans]|eukprot:CUG89407.1 Hypothetical protein, putative [Bodo saltans]